MAKKTKKRPYNVHAGAHVEMVLRKAYGKSLGEIAAHAGVGITTARAVIKRLGRKVKVNKKVYPAEYSLR